MPIERPGNVRGLLLSAIEAARSGRDAEAQRLCTVILLSAPGHADALHLMSLLARARGDVDAAIAYIRQVSTTPSLPAVFHRDAADAYRLKGLLTEAEAEARRAVDFDSGDSRSWIALGNVLRRSGRGEEAIAAYERGASLEPEHAAQPLVNKASVLIDLGRFDEAQAAVDAARTLTPASAPAWHAAAKLKTFAAGDPEIERMEAILASDGCAVPNDRVLLHFALGKACLDAGDPQGAFAHLDEGNRLHRATFSYDLDAAVRSLQNVVAAFSPDLLSRWRGAGAPSERPIFVIGMPRSGTSLVEQILASHSRVYGAGELNVLTHIASPVVIDRLDEETVRSLGEEYVAAVDAIDATAPRFVDKMPGNFVYAPFIAMILPNARIIHCRRDPLETCFSCYAQYFESGHPYAYDQTELGRYYRAYDATMAAWRAILPADRFLEVRYEEIVSNLPSVARRLIDFCGLEWEASCLSFYQTRRPVRTASAMQVRQPIYTGSVARAQAYRSFLAPLAEALF